MPPKRNRSKNVTRAQRPHISNSVYQTVAERSINGPETNDYQFDDEDKWSTTSNFNWAPISPDLNAEREKLHNAEEDFTVDWSTWEEFSPTQRPTVHSRLSLACRNEIAISSYEHKVCNYQSTGKDTLPYMPSHHVRNSFGNTNQRGKQKKRGQPKHRGGQNLPNRPKVGKNALRKARYRQFQQQKYGRVSPPRRGERPTPIRCARNQHSAAGAVRERPTLDGHGDIDERQSNGNQSRLDDHLEAYNNSTLQLNSRHEGIVLSSSMESSHRLNCPPMTVAPDGNKWFARQEREVCNQDHFQGSTESLDQRFLVQVRTDVGGIVERSVRLRQESIVLPTMTCGFESWSRKPFDPEQGLYTTEWKSFWHLRRIEKRYDATDSNESNWKIDWITFWDERMQELDNLEDRMNGMSCDHHGDQCPSKLINLHRFQQLSTDQLSSLSFYNQHLDPRLNGGLERCLATRGCNLALEQHRELPVTIPTLPIQRRYRNGWDR